MKYRKISYSAALAMTVIAGCATLSYQKVPQPERKRYFELAAVSSQNLADKYAAIADSSGREMFWHKFWKEKDPTPTTQKNERYEEHLKRVEYADQHFKDLLYHWDDRGRIFIKYGEPDYREANPLGDVLYNSDPFEADDGDNQEDFDPEKKILKLSGTHGWEKWTYSRLAQTFSFMQKDVGYCLVKDLKAAKSGVAKATVQSLMATDIALPTLSDTLVKDIFQHDYGQPLDFPFGLSRFADRNQTEVWIYSAVPLKQIGYDEVTRQGLLNRSIVIFDQNMNETGRNDNILTPEIPPGAENMEGAQAIDLAKFNLTPGSYEMAISLMDMNSGKTGIYKYKFTIIDYKSEAEETSDLILSGDIRSNDQGGYFNRNGYNIIPQPSHNFKKGQGLYFYYELYNLKSAENQPCRLKICYLIVSRKNNQARATEYSYLETTKPNVYIAKGLSTADLDAGNYYLMADIQDQISGRQKSIIRPFRIYK